MHKSQAIQNLNHARTAHIRTLNSIKMLVSGLTMEEARFKLGQTETDFGKWFYEEAMLFRSPKSKIHLEAIESVFSQLHDHYAKIYKIYFGGKSSGFASLLGKKRKPSEAEKELAQRLYEEMVVFSDQLKKHLNVFESQLHASSEADFENIEIPVPEMKEPEPEDTQYMYGARGH